MDKLYTATKGYKTYTGLVIAFFVGGLVYTNMIDAETARYLEAFAASLISFGLGDKLGRKMS